MREERGPWYLLTGIILGVILGLYYSWVYKPVKYIDTAPSTLRQDYKDQYRALIASAYAADGDLDRAQARLALLKDADLARTLTIQAQRALAENHPPAEAKALGLLAIAISEGVNPVTPPPPAVTLTPLASPSPLISPTPTLAATATPRPSPTPTLSLAPSPSPTGAVGLAQTPTASGKPSTTPTLALLLDTPQPSATPTATPGAPFVLQDKQNACDASPGQSLIIINVRNAAGQPVPGMEVVVNWPDGEDHFFTGLKPELGLGYADYTMTSGVIYTLHVGEGGQPVTGIQAGKCTSSSGASYWGTVRLTFTQP